MDKYSILKDFFGHDAFRGGQEAIVDRLLSGGDALCIMPTGAGKSVCYQVPALLLHGVTLVISPLISLMKDQVNALVLSGVAAAYINSSLTLGQIAKVLRNLGTYRIVYVAPERLATPEFVEACRHTEISLIAIDEAHCVSQWGQDFRPSYLKISDFIAQFPRRPAVGAFTATATKEVKEDIAKLLHLREPLTVTTGFDRSNLYFAVEQPKDKSQRLLELLRERSGRSGIVYCATRKSVEEVCQLLCQSGFPATRYHAGLSNQERRSNQDDFTFDRKRIMVATNAFGMGIDKSNVSFVIHYQMPKSIENYYQEAGRAGRDGASAECILLYAKKDVKTAQFLIEHSDPNPELSPLEQSEVRQRDAERLKFMTFYCTTSDCLRRFLLRYFDEVPPLRCENCSNCLAASVMTDVTIEAQQILLCVAQTKQRYGKKMILDILRGSKSRQIFSLGLDKQSTYGLLHARKDAGKILDLLIESGYLVTENTEYPVLRLTKASLDILHGETRLTMKNYKSNDIIKKEQPMDSELFRALKSLRLTLANKQNVPAFIIFSDATLQDICQKLPKTPKELLSISGIGDIKLQRYGDAFLKLLSEYT